MPARERLSASIVAANFVSKFSGFEVHPRGHAGVVVDTHWLCRWPQLHLLVVREAPSELSLIALPCTAVPRLT